MPLSRITRETICAVLLEDTLSRTRQHKNVPKRGLGRGVPPRTPTSAEEGPRPRPAPFGGTGTHLGRHQPLPKRGLDLGLRRRGGTHLGLHQFLPDIESLKISLVQKVLYTQHAESLVP